MNLRSKSKLHVEVSTHSLNDIMFFLLLFFLIVSTMVSPNVMKLMLPQAAKSPAPTANKPISVSVNSDEKYFIDNNPVEFEMIEPTLRNLTGKIQEPTIILKVDKELPVQKLVNVMEIGNKLKIKMVLATQAPSK